MVNGQLATWNSSTGAWSFGTSTGGGTGVSDNLTNTGDDWKYFAAQGFKVTGYQATIPVTNIATAESVISDASKRSGTWTDNPTTINYLNGSSGTGTTYTFQEGASSYASTVDTYIGSDSATTDHSTATTLDVDGLVTAGPAHTLLRFDNIFGSNAGQIPLGSSIASATLTINVSNSSVNNMSLYRMLSTWPETATWSANFGGNGIQADGTEALATADATVTPTSTGTWVIDVTKSLQAWSAGTANYGWAFLPGGTDGIIFASSENGTAASCPLLTVTLVGSSGSAEGHYSTNNNNFPGQGTTAVDNFVMQANYRVYIPAAGAWTFGVNSDDGFKLTLDNGIDPTRTMLFDGTRTVADTLSTFTFASAGTYNLRLVYFDNTGPAGVEVFAAQGTKTVYDTSFKLLGDIVGGGLSDSDQGTAWESPTFDDSSWLHGPSQLGYGDGDEATVTSYVDADPNTSGVQKNATTYFRRTFQVADASQYNGLIAHVIRDDGFVMYLNGVEVCRYNMPTGTITSTTWASSNVPDETVWNDYTIALSQLKTGTNVLAVEMHQYANNSSDISMDVRLEATRPGGSSGTGLNLTPGINRIPVQTFSGPNGTGTKLRDSFIDIWCDPTGTVADPPVPLADPPGLAPDPHLDLYTRDSYLPGIPFLVRTEIADAQEQVDRDLWNGTVTLSVNNPAITLSTYTVTYDNGVGSALVTATGSGTFTLTATWTDASRNLTKTATKTLTSLQGQSMTPLSGTLSGAGLTWSGIVHVTADVTVPTGSTLTIQPGTLVLPGRRRARRHDRSGHTGAGQPPVAGHGRPAGHLHELRPHHVLGRDPLQQCRGLAP